MASTLSGALEMIVRTDPGMVREHNEDAVFANSGLGLAILADGMGGYNAGEVASGMAIRLLSSGLESAFAGVAPATTGSGGESESRRCLREQIALTNTAIYHAAISEPQYSGMGTTLVAALFHDNRVTVAHIGDSRLYRLRGDHFCTLTRDHSLLQEQIDSGLISAEEARYSLNRNLVTRALGVDPVVETEISEHAVLPGDIYLLCSDGLNDMVPDEEIRQILQALPLNLELAAKQLIRMANDNGGRDNVSVILVKVLRAFPAARNWQTTFSAWFK